jgi:hypothetical protein
VVFKWETHDYYYLTETWDRSPSDILCSKDRKTLYLTTEEYGCRKLFEIPFDKGETRNLSCRKTQSFQCIGPASTSSSHNLPLYPSQYLNFTPPPTPPLSPSAHPPPRSPENGSRDSIALRSSDSSISPKTSVAKRTLLSRLCLTRHQCATFSGLRVSRISRVVRLVD